MENEKMISITERFVKFGFSIEELMEIAPFINSEEFKENYETVYLIKLATSEIGRENLRMEIRSQMSKIKKAEPGPIIFLRNYKLHLVAASVLIICGLTILKTSNPKYNDIKNYRKAYIEKV